MDIYQFWRAMHLLASLRQKVTYLLSTSFEHVAIFGIQKLLLVCKLVS